MGDLNLLTNFIRRIFCNFVCSRYLKKISHFTITDYNNGSKIESIDSIETAEERVLKVRIS